MTGPNISVSSKGAGIANVQKALAQLARTDVLVGIPQERASRPGQPVNNAELLYIHTHGSPIRHIPPRAVIEPAINAPGNKEVITRELGDAAAAALDQKPAECIKFLRRAGLAGSNASKAWFTDSRNGWPPNARSTVLAKLRRLKGKAHEDAMTRIADMDYIGTIPDVNTVLVDTGDMRRAITFVVRQVK